MAGSYQHCVDENFKLHTPEMLINQIENMGDAYEAIEELVGMINVLTKGHTDKIYEAVVEVKSDLYPHYKAPTFEKWLSDHKRIYN